MPHRFTNVLREPEILRGSDIPHWYWLAIGITLLLGLVSGVIWIGWELLRIHVLGWR